MANDSNDTQKGCGEENSRSDPGSEQTRPAPPYDENSYGYDLFPERRGEAYKPSWSGVLFRGEGKEQYDKIRCERNVYSCVKNSPLIKLMLGALKASGCEIDIRRHIACEVCDSSVSGGYDPVLNQVVICQNVARKEGIVQGSLTHELIHMFDYCENKLDFKNLDHLACTEIRAANLAHCSFISACLQGDASVVNVKKMHQVGLRLEVQSFLPDSLYPSLNANGWITAVFWDQECVKTKAMSSVLSTRKVTPQEALAAIERVFDRCYNDLEPIGRRIRRNSADMHKAYLEGEYYGYTQ